MDLSPLSAEFYLGFGEELNRTSVADGLAVPVLSGQPQETLFSWLRAQGDAAGFSLFESQDWLVGWRSEEQTADIGTQTERIYRDMLELVRKDERHLVRVWNYVPEINAEATEGLETYQVFCRGRAMGFARAGWQGPLPAASAVGGPPGVLAVMFAATRERPVARENPEQVPAFEYPLDYGPNAPSFSRAMQVLVGGRRWVFVSGTAAIKGHESRAAGDLAGQIACTLDNLRLVSRACGLGENLGAGTEVERHFKIYLRDAARLAEAREKLERQGGLLGAGDRVTWLLADICRADLEIEIEATVVEQTSRAAISS